MTSNFYPDLAVALAIALVASVVFLGAASAWLSAGRRLQPRSPFPGQILFEAGHRARQQWRQLDTKYAVYLAGLLVFVLMLAAAMALGARAPRIDLPHWGWIAACGVLAAASLYLPFQIVKLYRGRKRLAYQRDANVAVGHALQKIAAKGNRVFHHVRSGKVAVDNVVVGAKGVYAINVFVFGKSRNRDASVKLDKTHLILGGARHAQPLTIATKRVNELGRELSRFLGHAVNVRSVIAVPGWNVTTSGGNGHLLVNEKTVVTLTGWTDPNAYLMDEDVDKIHQFLSTRCSDGKG